MFTGIITDKGQIEHVALSDQGMELRISTRFTKLVLGESIAVSGTCLTVTASTETSSPTEFTVFASAETLEKTTLKHFKQGTFVNLERALAAGDRLGGHIVSGHVDTVGQLVSRTLVGDAEKFVFAVPKVLLPYISVKGSIAVDGVSLTINGVNENTFDVMLIPHTLSVTTLSALKPNDAVNLEVDMIARYVVRAMNFKDSLA